MITRESLIFVTRQLNCSGVVFEIQLAIVKYLEQLRLA